MKNPWLAGLAGLSCLFLTAGTLSAQKEIGEKVYVPPTSPLPFRVATAQTIVVGKVIRVEANAVQAKQYPQATNKIAYNLAVVRVETAVQGAKGMKEVRVGFLPNNRGTLFALTKDQEVCLFLAPHFDGDFLTPATNSNDLIDKKTNANFAKDVAEVQRCAKLLADPTAGLESKKADERYLTAAMLIARYRTVRPYSVNPRQEPIDITESQKILKILAEADWTVNKGARVTDPLAPQSVFQRLNLTAGDFWTPPTDFNEYPTAAKKWLQDNGLAYRIKRYVTE
jgi:hypothetical protein